jgi:hypothetical protein
LPFPVLLFLSVFPTEALAAPQPARSGGIAVTVLDQESLEGNRAAVLEGSLPNR